MLLETQDRLLRQRLRAVNEIVVIVGEKSPRDIGLDPGPSLIGRIAEIDGRRDHPAVRARVDRRARLIGPERRRHQEMKAGECLGNEGLELLARQRRPAENVHLPEEADIGNAVRAGAEWAGAGVDERIGQNDRETAGAAPVVHDPRQDDRLGEHVGANARHGVRRRPRASPRSYSPRYRSRARYRPARSDSRAPSRRAPRSKALQRSQRAPQGRQKSERD